MYNNKFDNDWYNQLKKSPYTPAPIVFTIVWTILYLLIFTGIYMYISNKYDSLGITLFSVQMFLNLIWTYIFFTLKKPVLAFADLILLWITVLLTIQNFYMYNEIAAYLLVPYFIWITYAMYLNYYIVVNN